MSLLSEFFRNPLFFFFFTFSGFLPKPPKHSFQTPFFCTDWFFSSFANKQKNSFLGQKKTWFDFWLSCQSFLMVKKKQSLAIWRMLRIVQLKFSAVMSFSRSITPKHQHIGFKEALIFSYKMTADVKLGMVNYGSHCRRGIQEAVSVDFR